MSYKWAIASQLLGARCVIRGGNANNGTNAGFGYVNVNNDVGNANTNYGGRLNAVKTSELALVHHRKQGEYNVPTRVSKSASAETESSRITQRYAA